MKRPAVDERLQPFPCHGARHLHGLDVISYNVEMRMGGRFIGDWANRSAFFERIDEWRRIAREKGTDPFGRKPTVDLTKRSIDRVFRNGDPVAVGILESALEDYAGALANIIERFLRTEWKGVERIAVGGGFSRGRLAALAIGRAQILLHDRKSSKTVELAIIPQEPDEIALLGAVSLVPPWMLAGYDSLLAVDIGGSNLRCGLVGYEMRGRDRVRRVKVLELRRWRHADDDASRRELLDEMILMLERLTKNARKRGARLAPMVGIGCPGIVDTDGRILRGAQNLPGEWSRPAFHLPSIVAEGLISAMGTRPAVILHNDAVLQGLGATRMMRKTKRWAALTIGTGLGNVAFETVATTRPAR